MQSWSGFLLPYHVCWCNILMHGVPLSVALLLCLRLCVSSVLPVPMVAQVGQQLFVAPRLAMKSSIGYSSVDQVKHPMHGRLSATWMSCQFGHILMLSQLFYMYRKRPGRPMLDEDALYTLLSKGSDRTPGLAAPRHRSSTESLEA